MARITAADVAREAGVSQSAVSRVFTPGGSFSPETAAKVRAAAERLGYRPNRLAQGLITGRTRLVGLVVPGFANPFHAALADRLARALSADGFQALLLVAGPGGVDPAAVPGLLLDYQVEGIVALACGLPAGAMADAVAAGVPVVAVDGGAEDAPGVTVVETDGMAAGRVAAEHLIAGGHRRFVHLAAPQGGRVAQDRAAGFLAGLEAAGRKPWAVVDPSPDPADALEAVRRLFARPRKPDALFVGSDHLALAVLDLLRHDLGVQVPAEVSVIGHDDAPPAASAAHALTTIAQPVGALVAATVAALAAGIAGTGAALPPTRAEGTLVLRGTTRRPDGAAPADG